MMVYNHDEIILAIRELRNAVHDLMNADYMTYESNAKYIIGLIKSNSVLSEVIGPFLHRQLNLQDIEQNHGNGWGNLILPIERESKIAYGLQVLEHFSQNENSAIIYATNFFYNKTYNVSLRKINEQLFTPVFRGVFDNLNDLEKKHAPEREVKPYVPMYTINIGSLNANAPVAVGHEIYQSVTTQTGLGDQMIEALIQNKMAMTDVEKIRGEIYELAKELVKQKPEVSIIRASFDKICDFGQKLAIPIIAGMVNRPEVYMALTQMLHK